MHYVFIEIFLYYRRNKNYTLLKFIYLFILSLTYFNSEALIIRKKRKDCICIISFTKLFIFRIIFFKYVSHQSRFVIYPNVLLYFYYFKLGERHALFYLLYSK